MNRQARLWIGTFLSLLCLCVVTAPSRAEERYTQPLNVQVPHISTDTTVKLDCPIVYVRAPRFGDAKNSR